MTDQQSESAWRTNEDADLSWPLPPAVLAARKAFTSKFMERIGFDPSNYGDAIWEVLQAALDAYLREQP